MTRIWAVLTLLLAAGWGSAPAQVSGAGAGAGLASAAAAVRQAWLHHDADAIVESTPRVLIQLPGADPATALGRAQAAALLREFLAPAEEVAVDIRAAREVDAGRGFVELARRYRIRGTQETRSQSLLLGYRWARGAWQLVEVRVVG